MFLGVDVGGTNIRIASFETLRSPKFKKIEKIKASNNYKNDLENIKRATQKLTKRKINGVGAGIPAVIDKARTKALLCTLGDWEGKLLKADLSTRLNCPIQKSYRCIRRF